MCNLIFNGELTIDQIDVGQAFMDSEAEYHNSKVDKIVTELKVSEDCASNIVYLRSRHRHTQALENQLIALHTAGTPPNMNEFGCTKETGEALLNAALTSVASKYLPQPDAY